MAHGWNPYLHSFSSLPSDHGTTDPGGRHPAVPSPGDDFIAHGGFSNASISHGASASASNTNYFFSNSSGNNISNWGSETENAQRNYRQMAWQPDGEQKAYPPRWDSSVSNFATNVLETAGHHSVPPQLGCKQDTAMPKGSQYFENCQNNQGSSDQVCQPRSSFEFMTGTSEHNSQSGATPGYHSPWLQRHTNNNAISADRRYSNMWPNPTTENATKYVQDIGKSIQPDRISFANSHAYTNSERGHFDNTSKPKTYVNMCQNANISENYNSIDSQTMMDTSETNKTKHLDSAHESFTENQVAYNPKQDILLSDSSQQENYKDAPSQSSSQSSVSNDLVSSEASSTDASEASNDSQPSFLTSALSADNEKVSETADSSRGSQQCPAARDANSDSSMHSETHMGVLTETVCENPAAPSIEVVSAFSPSSTCDPSTLNAGDKIHESSKLKESNAACKSVCGAATIDNKTNQSDPVKLAPNITEIINQPKVNELLDSAANVSINSHTSDSVDSAFNVNETVDQQNSAPNLMNSDPAAHVIETIDDKSNESEPIHSHSAAHEPQTVDDKTNESEPVDADSPAHVPETDDDKTEREAVNSETAASVDDKTGSEVSDADSAAHIPVTIEDHTNDSELIDPDSRAHVPETSADKTQSEATDSVSPAHVPETDDDKTEREANNSETAASVDDKTGSEVSDADSAAHVPVTIEDQTNDSSRAHVPETSADKTQSEATDPESSAHVPGIIEEKTQREQTDSDSAAHITATIEVKTESEPVDLADNVTCAKDQRDHYIKAVENKQLCPEDMTNMCDSDHFRSSSDAASTSTTNTINDKVKVVFDSQPKPMEDFLNKMQEKVAASSYSTPNVTCDQTNDNGIEKTFSNINTIDKELQQIPPEEKISPKMKIKQEFTETTPNTSEIKQVQHALDNLSFFKSEFPEQIHSDEHLTFDDFGKPLTPSPSEMEESLVSPEMRPSTKMSKRLQPIVLVKTTELTHLVSDKYICAQCMHITSNVDDLIEHQSLQHPVRSFQLCMSCGKYLVHQNQSRQHLCGEENGTVSLKSNNQKRPKKFCKRCKMNFSHWNDFVRHMRTHTGATPYKCEKCGVYFAQSSTLGRHKKISVHCGRPHTNIQRAPKKFHKHPLKSMVSCYVKLYDISKSQFCKFCGKCFASPTKLNKHFHNVHKKKVTISKESKNTSEKTKLVSEKRKYKCPLCPETFSHYINRNNHLKACVKESTFGSKNKVKGRYKCPLCLATFTLKSNRYRHLHRFCLRNFLLCLGKNSSIPVKYPRYSKQMEIVLRNLKAEEEQLNGEQSENVPYTKSKPRFECNVCQAVFLNKSSKYRHIKKHKVTGHRFKYRHSNDKSITLSPMTDTNDRLKKDDSVKCKYCEKSFASQQALKKHEFIHKGDRPFYCSQCGKVFKSRVILIQHKITHQRRIQCTVCKKILPTIGELIQHRTSHTTRGMLQCPDCPRQFTFPVFLLRHLRYHLKTQNKFLHQDPTDSPPQAPSTNHPCPFCSQVFDNAKLLRRHYLTHIPKSDLQCSFCKRKFTGRRYLLRHIALHIGRKPLSMKKESKEFICRFCSRPFQRKGYLVRHYKGHSKKTLIQCERCKFYYGVSKYSLHKRMCQNEDTGLTSQASKQLAVDKPPSAKTKLQCQHCSQTFKYPSLFRRHLLTHKDMEVHACILCGQNFPTIALCSLHEASCVSLYKSKEAVNKSATHSDASERKCKFCNKTFTKARNLRRHILTHNEVKPYRCKACESCFSRYDHLKVHLGRCLGKEKLQLKPQICIPKISLDHVGTGWQKLGKTVKQTLECKICARKFATQSKLKWHNSMFHTVKRLKCMQCGTFFSHEKSLQNHIRNRRCRLANIVKGKKQTQTTKTHSSNKQNVFLTRILPTSTEQKAIKTIKCNFCSRTFRTSAHLKVHRMLHCENSYVCDCGKRFFHKAKLQRHVTTCGRKQNQSSPRGFSCAYCSSRFLLFSQLQEHFLNSHKLEIKEEPVETAPLQHHLSKIQYSEKNMDVSDPSYTSKLTLPFEGKKSQVASELRECPFSCKICYRGFWNKTTLRNHFRKCSRSSLRVTQPKEEDVQLRADINMVLTDSEAEDSNDEVEDSEQLNKSLQEKKTAVYQCSECDKSFTDGLLLISHLEAHGREEQEKRLNKCSKCGKTFLNQARLEKHMKIHENVLLICKDCSTVFPSETELEIHRKQCHDPSAPYSCQICHYRFKAKTSLAEHCSKNHPDNIFPCNICNKIYTLRASLNRHNKNHHGQEIKEGAEKSLSTQSSSESELAGGNDDAHYNNEDDDGDSDSDSADSDSVPYFPCHVCGKTFTTSESLEDHQRCHLGEKPFECAQCGQCFFQAGQLQQHERKHKSEFQCRICGRGFVSLFALRKHKHTSGKKRPFRCKKCPLYFTTSALLAEHMLCHREESFPCDICNRVFPSKSSRADHRKIHMPKSTEQPVQSAVKAVQPENKPAALSVPGEFKYRCGVCCLRFRNPEELSEHGCLASTERQYSCVDCDKHFLHSSHLTKHLLRHKRPSTSRKSTQSKYPCNQCNKGFSSPQDFLKHLRNHEETVNHNSSRTGFVCPVCYLSFTRSAELALHFPSHQSDLPATQLKEHKACHSKETKCEKCGQIVQGTDHKCSARHIELLNIVSSFSADDDEIDVTGEDHCFCPFCPMQFSSRSNLLEHQNKQHPNEKSYTCEICTRTYAKQKYLDKHVKKHHQPSTTQSTSQIHYKCAQCNTDFNSAKDLSVHLKLHAAQKEVGEYRCDMCYKSFGQLQLLRRHQESHVGQVVYECTECDKAFAFPHLLEEHQKSHV